MTRNSYLRYIANRLSYSSFLGRAQTFISHIKPLVWLTRTARALLFIIAYVQTGAVFLILFTVFLILAPVLIIVSTANIAYGAIVMKRKEKIVAEKVRGRVAIVFFSHSDSDAFYENIRILKNDGFCVFVLVEDMYIHPLSAYREMYGGVVLFRGHCWYSLRKILDINANRLVCIY